jgi:hypothetical protein
MMEDRKAEATRQDVQAERVLCEAQTAEQDARSQEFDALRAKTLVEKQAIVDRLQELGRVDGAPAAEGAEVAPVVPPQVGIAVDRAFAMQLLGQLMQRVEDELLRTPEAAQPISQLLLQIKAALETAPQAVTATVLGGDAAAQAEALLSGSAEGQVDATAARPGGTLFSACCLGTAGALSFLCALLRLLALEAACCGFLTGWQAGLLRGR